MRKMAENNGQECEVCLRVHGMAQTHTPEEYLHAAKRALAAIIKQRDTAHEEARKWKLALHSVTPGGSEFIDDPERCVNYVRDARSSLFENMGKFKQERDEAIAATAAVQADADAWKEKAVNLCLYFGPMLMQMEDIKRIFMNLPANAAIMETMIRAAFARLSQNEVVALRQLMQIDRMSYLSPKQEVPDFIATIDALSKELKELKAQQEVKAKIGQCGVCHAEAWEQCQDENEVPMKTAIGISYWRCKNCRYGTLKKLWAQVRASPIVIGSTTVTYSHAHRHQQWIDKMTQETVFDGEIQLALSEAILKTIHVMQEA